MDENMFFDGDEEDAEEESEEDEKAGKLNSNLKQAK